MTSSELLHKNWTLFGYVVVNELGFVCPCFKSAGSQSEVFLAQGLRRGGVSGTYKDFEKVDLDDICFLPEKAYREVSVGDQQIDVFLWRGVEYVGTAAELWAALLPHRSDLMREAPLSLLDLAERIPGVDAIQYASIAFSYLATNHGERQAIQWRDSTYFRPRAYRVVHSLIASRSPEHQARVAFRDVRIISKGDELQIVISPDVSNLLGRELNGQLETLEREMTKAAKVFQADLSQKLRTPSSVIDAARDVETLSMEAQWKDDIRAARILLFEASDSSSYTTLMSALGHYEEICNTINKTKEPQRWTAALEEFGAALRLLGSRFSDRTFFTRAISVYESALEVITELALPKIWSDLQFHLGTVLRDLGEREGDLTILERSRACIKASLRPRLRTKYPILWALSWKELGNTHRLIGQQSGDDKQLDLALKAHWWAEKIIDPRVYNAHWSDLQNDIGKDFFCVGEGEVGVDTLRLAIEAYYRALTGITREALPLEWAAIQNNLGIALFRVGERQASLSILWQAVEAQRAALEERTRARAPFQWAGTQVNIGISFYRIGVMSEDLSYVRQSITHFELALNEYNSEQTPIDWAFTLNNLGNALKAVGCADESASMLSRAAASFKRALELFEARGLNKYSLVAGENLQSTLQSAGELSTGQQYTRHGVVRWFDTTKGFGFIMPATGGTDVFVHIRTVRTAGLSTLNQGQKVNYIVPGDRSPPGALDIELES